MSAVIQRRVASPAVSRSQSVGRRSRRQRHADPALAAGHRRTGAGEVGERAARTSPGRARRRRRGRRPTASRRAASPRCGPRPGRRPPERSTRTPAGRGRSAQVERSPSAPGAVVDDDDRSGAGPVPPASASSSARRLGRPTVGTTTRRSSGSSVIATRPRPAYHEGADRQQVDGRGAEALERVARVVDHRPAGGVEAGVDHHGQAGAVLEAPRASARPAARRPGRRSAPGRCRRRARPPGCGRATAGATSCTNSMYGEGSGPRAKISRRALGQHHRRDRPELLAALDVVEPLEVLARDPGWASRERWPSARGPYSLRPWNQATMPSCGEALGDRVGDVGRPLVRHPCACCSHASISSSVQPRPRSAPGIGCGTSPSARRHVQRAAERGAGVAGGRLHPDVARTALGSASRVLATQLSATPPASVSASLAGAARAASATRSSSTSSSRSCTLAARSAWSSVHSSPAPRRLASDSSRRARCGSRRRRWRAPRGAARRGTAACRRRPAPSPCTRRCCAGSRGAR